MASRSWSNRSTSRGCRPSPQRRRRRLGAAACCKAQTRCPPPSCRWSRRRSKPWCALVLAAGGGARWRGGHLAGVLQAGACATGAAAARGGRGGRLGAWRRLAQLRIAAQPAMLWHRPVGAPPAGARAHLRVAAGVSSLDRSTLASLGLEATTCRPGKGGGSGQDGRMVGTGAQGAQAGTACVDERQGG